MDEIKEEMKGFEPNDLDFGAPIGKTLNTQDYAAPTVSIHELRLRKLRMSSLKFWEIPHEPRHSTPQSSESDLSRTL